MPRALDQLRQEAKAASSRGWNLLAELLSAIAVWSAVGFGLDTALGTGPLFVAIGAFIGHAMAIYIAFWRTGQLHGGRQGGTRTDER